MTDAATLGDSSNIYHEKQFLMRCGLHSVNNMLQRRAFSANEFDAIAETLAQTTDSTWGFSPYRAVLGIGNFGVDVLTTALLRYGHRTTYFDRRKSLDSIDLSSVKGLLCNISSSRMLGLWQTRHWFTIRQIDRVYYNLDSKLPAPVVRVAQTPNSRTPVVAICRRRCSPPLPPVTPSIRHDNSARCRDVSPRVV
ncbi:hypothetical protein H310_04586 [Aphanomyces invadans]|uniref:ubiquitinyl hydrolase 1 n=1 Tax=Aphanomyces invadans TaxID=157072 RepID=A0A024UF38_9STRA|nr:hypothetical protein H310_04586 [Aphanomyces invadans]ETW04258.1 hypothetical protein H310_04586 [Aphanomyces invadans]|eukprot:XP_008867214.1 hypothetical protein H310_04586 [Aphanomyces invadans]